MNWKVIKKYLIVIIIILGFFYSKCQTYSSLITDKEIYCFLNWLTLNEKKHYKETFLLRKHINVKIISWDSANFIDSLPHDIFEKIYLFNYEYGIDTLFNKQDKIFLFQQFLSIRDKKWHKNFNKSKLVDYKKLKPPHFYYSIPLFSNDRKYVILRQFYICGLKCGTWGDFVYKKVGDKKWEKINVGLMTKRERND